MSDYNNQNEFPCNICKFESYMVIWMKNGIIEKKSQIYTYFYFENEIH